MQPLVITLFLAILVCVLLSTALAAKLVEAQRRRRVNQILESVKATDDQPRVSVVRRVPEHKQAWRARVQKSSWYRRLDARIEAAGLGWSADKVLLACLLLGAVGASAGWAAKALFSPALGAAAFGAAGVFGPLLLIERKRKRRIAEFEKLFPEALDFLARSVRAGHALTISLELLGAESSEPVRTEFRRLSGEQSLGASLEEALGNLAERIPLIDVRFFVSAVLLQRETGGNLSDILEKLSHVIRERFRIRGQVRAITAHGRITAGVLTCMPLVVAAMLSVVAPDYLSSMAKDPAGRLMLIGSAIGQVLGYLCMQRIINIKV